MTQNIFRFRVELYDMGASRGPGTLKAIIDDAKDIGVSEYANAAGELFFTLPYNHPSIAQIVPLQRHYRVVRWNTTTEVFDTIARGIIDDFQATTNEIIVYGTNYIGLLTGTITASTTSYTDTFLGTIVTDQLSTAINETNSRLAFTSLGTIQATAQTATLISAFQTRLDFIKSAAEISMADSSVRTMLTLPRNSPFAWAFTENIGQDRTSVRLEWGGIVNDFVYQPGFADFATTIKAIGVKREGATILYSTQSYASTATYGYIASPRLHQNLVNQTALDRLAKRDARRAGNPSKRASLAIRSGKLIPWDGWDLGDSLRVVLSRGDLVNLNALYTVWGMEWTAQKNGQEDLFLDLATKET